MCSLVPQNQNSKVFRSKTTARVPSFSIQSSSFCLSAFFELRSPKSRGFDAFRENNRLVMSRRVTVFKFIYEESYKLIDIAHNEELIYI